MDAKDPQNTPPDSDRIRQLEFERGWIDAEHGWPPAAVAGPYLLGYLSIRPPYLRG